MLTVNVLPALVAPTSVPGNAKLVGLTLRRAGAIGEVMDGLCGWTRGDMRSRYGSGPWIIMLAEAMQRVEYPGLDLTHLQPR